MVKNICFHVNKFFPYMGGTELLAKQIIDYIHINTKFNIVVKTSKEENRKNIIFPYIIEEDQFLREEQFFDISVFFSDLWSEQLANYSIKKSKKNICILNLDEMTYPYKYNFKTTINNLKKFDLVITFTINGIANRFLEEEKINNLYIPNFSRDVLSNPKIFNLKEKLKLDDKKVALYCAAYDVRKNQLSLLESIKKSDILKNYNWIFIGNNSDIEYQKKCVNYVKYNNLKNIFFVSPTTEEIKIDTLYQQVDLVVLLSLAEGMPLTLLESLSANKPLISTPVGGVSGVLKDGIDNGVYILEKVNYELEDLENNILKSNTYNSQHLRNMWLKNHQKSLILEKYKKLFDDL